MIDESKKQKAISLFLRGLKYEEIHSRLSISMGEVSKIINDYRQVNPEYEQLQKLADKLPIDSDFAQYNQLFDSLISLQKQLDCPIEQVPSLVKDKVAMMDEISSLEQKRNSLAEELDELEKFKQELKSDVNFKKSTMNKLAQDIRVKQFEVRERQRELTLLHEALNRGRKWLKQ